MRLSEPGKNHLRLRLLHGKGPAPRSTLIVAGTHRPGHPLNLFELNYLGVPDLCGRCSGVWMLPSHGKPPDIEGQSLSRGVCHRLPSLPLTHPHEVTSHGEHRRWHFHLLLAQQAQMATLTLHKTV